VMAGGVALVIEFLSVTWFGQKISWAEVFSYLVSKWWIEVGLILIAVVLFRRVLGRMGEPDQRPDAANR
jgi:hypothetical protein